MVVTSLRFRRIRFRHFQGDYAQSLFFRRIDFPENRKDFLFRSIGKDGCDRQGIKQCLEAVEPMHSPDLAKQAVAFADKFQRIAGVKFEDIAPDFYDFSPAADQIEVTLFDSQ